jgi:indolepyruvate ferredoxin oxidoreductase
MATTPTQATWSDALQRTVTLDDKYSLEDGRVFITGIQSLVRVIIDHQRADRRRGLHTATFVSGYPGSPLGGFDLEMARANRWHGALDIYHAPGLNEDLSAAAMWGSQLATTLPKSRYDGVLGVWYGKAPGLDRSSDAIRQANLSGTGRLDGVVTIVGDDPTSKSSTAPSASEGALAELCMPVFYPGNVQEIVDYGPHAITCSRATGLWTGLKIVTNVADSAGTIDAGYDRVTPVIPDLRDGDRPFEHKPVWNILAPGSLVLERSMFDFRLEMARRYERENAINRITVSGRDDWLGIVAAGKAHADLREALKQLRLSDADLNRLGVRLWKLGMIYPLHRTSVSNFADGLSQILVLEDKRPFIEGQIKQLLYGSRCQPEIVGKEDEHGRLLLPMGGELDPALIARAIVDRLRTRDLAAPFEETVGHVNSLAARTVPAVLPRAPYFCSGCPHTRSTRTADETLVGVGIGCHTMVVLNPEGHGRLSSMTQMGGEGAQWVGMAPFTDDAHFVQNMGDGTFFHSGSLTLRWAIAAKVNITYKLLYNGAVAMTGGQDAVGGRAIPDVTRLLAAEGVKRTIITTAEPSRYDGVALAPNCEVRSRDELAEAEAELARTLGVTVLLHDQHCAAEARRMRKRGKLETPDLRVVINQRVCEGCGDCGRKSNCLSVVPVETEFGRKTEIHEPSCNKDFTCLDGDCPSFITVRGAIPPARRPLPRVPVALPEPRPRIPDGDVRIRMPGIGGTGVVTINQILGVAALIDGKHVLALDQTGLAQKGGAVVSDLTISSGPVDGSNKVPAGALDVYLVFDVLAATTTANLVACDPARTVAVVSTSRVATGQMVTDPAISFPQLDDVIGRLGEFTRSDENVFVDAESLAVELFGDHMQGNPLLLGAAYQAGLLPLSHDSIAQAFTLNGVAVERNLAAFEWGRAAVAAPEAVARARAGDAIGPAAAAPRTARLLNTIDAGPELRRVLEIRVPDLIAYQNRRYAVRYLEFVKHVQATERTVAPDVDTPITRSVAIHLHKLMAYKDEYEVARLLLDPAHVRALREQVGPDAQISWRLHPPFLRTLGLKRKLSLGPWFAPALQMLIPMRRLRGTDLDPFGRSEVRRVERELIVDYERDVRYALTKLTPATRDKVLRVCDLPDLVRGYEDVKLATVSQYRREMARALDSLSRPDEPILLSLTSVGGAA